MFVVCYKASTFEKIKKYVFTNTKMIMFEHKHFKDDDELYAMIF